MYLYPVGKEAERGKAITEKETFKEESTSGEGSETGK